MGKNKRKQRNRRRDRQAPVTSAPAPSPMANKHEAATPATTPWRDLFSAMAVALFFVRFLLPAESAPMGETLWITIGWFGLLVSALLAQIAQGQRKLVVYRCEIWPWIIIAGYVVSTVVILINGGDRRAATNLACEWIASGIAISILLRLLSNHHVRRQFITQWAAIAIALAGLGIYQTYVFYPGMGEVFRELSEQHDELSLRPLANERELAELEREMFEQGIPVDKELRVQFGNRLLNSTEPFGLFALANSFGGFLAVSCLIVIGLCLRQILNKVPMPAWALTIMGLLLILFCLILTKNRTAWLGSLTGVGFLILFAAFQTQGTLRKWLWTAILGSSAVIILLGGTAFLSGMLDLEVISEVGKSFRYRLEYWQATRHMILDHPLFGVGPGNFRQAYLQYKLPQASEEVLDPHNFLLEVVSNAGLIGLVGIAGLIGLLVVRLANSLKRPVETTANEAEPVTNNPLLWWSVPAAFLLAFFVPLLIGFSYDERPLLLGLIATVLSLVWTRFPHTHQHAESARTAAHIVGQPIFLAAALAFLLHLTAAGGIGRPVFFQMFCLLIVSSGKSPATHEVHFKYASHALLAGTCLLAIPAWIWVWNPHFTSNWHLQQAKLSSSIREAEQHIELALSADPWNVEAHSNAVQLAQQTYASIGADKETLDKRFEQLVSADPNNASTYAQMGRWELEMYSASSNKSGVGDALISSAISHLRTAVRLYPTNAKYHADLARAYELSGNAGSAKTYAKSALELNQTKARAGHVDKLLDENTVQMLRQLAGD